MHLAIDRDLGNEYLQGTGPNKPPWTFRKDLKAVNAFVLQSIKIPRIFRKDLNNLSPFFVKIIKIPRVFCKDVKDLNVFTARANLHRLTSNAVQKPAATSARKPSLPSRCDCRAATSDDREPNQGEEMEDRDHMKNPLR
jgi:hypothetical protein